MRIRYFTISEFINIVFILFYNFIEFIIVIYVFSIFYFFCMIQRLVSLVNFQMNYLLLLMQVLLVIFKAFGLMLIFEMWTVLRVKDLNYTSYAIQCIWMSCIFRWFYWTYSTFKIIKTIALKRFLYHQNFIYAFKNDFFYSFFSGFFGFVFFVKSIIWVDNSTWSSLADFIKIFLGEKFIELNCMYLLFLHKLNVLYSPFFSISLGFSISLLA